MPYIGKSPEHGNFQELTDVSGSFNGSTTAFALTTRIGGIAITPVVEAALLISLDGVVQEPTTDYTVSGTNITFTTAPASTVSFFGVVMGRQLDVGTPSDSTVTAAKLASTFFTGATDIGAAIVDADLLMLDDGAGGTIRKTTASRLKTYIGGNTPSSADGQALGSASLEWSDLFLADGGIIKFGNDQDVTLTHVADTGILLNSTMAIQFNDASQYINAPSNAILDINATDEIELNATAVDLNGTLDVSGATTAAAITASGIIKTDDTTAATSTTDGSLQTDGGLSVAADAIIGDDLKLLSDAAVLSFGADSDVTVTHVHNTGVLLNSTMAIQFNDASQYINAPSNAILDINATDEIELNATLVDINANVEISGTATTTGVHTFTAVPVFPNNTVETADIQADAITGAKIADDAIDSEHYTDGSIDNAHIADDAIDSEHYAAGSIDAAHLADDAVTLAKMAAGTDGNLISYDTSGNPVAVAAGNDGQVLTSAGAGAVCLFEDAPGGGKVLQVEHTANNTEVSSDGGYADTGTTDAITPAHSSNKILVQVSQHIGNGDPGGPAVASIRLLRGTTEVEEWEGVATSEARGGQFMFQHLDSPSTTSATTYHTEYKKVGLGGTIFINDDRYATATSTMTLIELDYS